MSSASIRRMVMVAQATRPRQLGLGEAQGAAVLPGDLAKGDLLWTGHWGTGVFHAYDRTAAIHPPLNRYVAVGASETRVWDLDNPDQQSTVLATSGDTDIEDVSGPGVAYHPDTDRIVAWSGGPDVYALDYDTATWTRIQATGGSAPTSTPTVYGKWRNIASRDVFIVTTLPTANVVRLAPGGPAVRPGRAFGRRARSDRRRAGRGTRS